MKFNKLVSNIISISIFATLFFGCFCSAEKVLALTGREIMEKVNARDTGHSSITEMEMILMIKKARSVSEKLKTLDLRKERLL